MFRILFNFLILIRKGFSNLLIRGSKLNSLYCIGFNFFSLSQISIYKLPFKTNIRCIWLSISFLQSIILNIIKNLIISLYLRDIKKSWTEIIIIIMNVFVIYIIYYNKNLFFESKYLKHKICTSFQYKTLFCFIFKTFGCKNTELL